MIGGRAKDVLLPRIALRGFLGAALVLYVTASAGAAVINVQGSGSTSTIGGGVTVDLAISGLSSAPNESLSAFDVNVLFNPTVLAFASGSFIDPLTGVNQLQWQERGSFSFLGTADDIGGGTLDVFGVSGNTTAVLDANQANAFIFARLTFRVVAAQSTTVVLDTLDTNLGFANSGASPLLRAYGSTSVQFVPQVVVIPEPSTAVTMSLAALLIATLGRHLLVVRKEDHG